eukprot:6440746-Prymnesium_polylepis.1
MQVMTTAKSAVQSNALHLYRSHAAVCRRLTDLLPNESRAERQVPSTSELVLVGCGVRSLVFANRFVKEHGSSLAILEKSSYIGGIWYEYANPFSRVQNSEPSYRLPVRRSYDGYLHQPFTHEVLESCKTIIMQDKLKDTIYLSAKVSGSQSSCSTH